MLLTYFSDFVQENPQLSHPVITEGNVMFILLSTNRYYRCQFKTPTADRIMLGVPKFSMLLSLLRLSSLATKKQSVNNFAQFGPVVQSLAKILHTQTRKYSLSHRIASNSKPPTIWNLDFHYILSVKFFFFCTGHLCDLLSTVITTHVVPCSLRQWSANA